MYGLPAGFDASGFVNRELVEVCFTVNTVHLAFDDDASITLESAFALRSHQGAERQTPPIKASRLMGLIGQRVRSSHAHPDGTLTLEFEEGDALDCLDDSKEYESYKIRVDGREFIV